MVLLQHLSRDVQREVGRINHAANEAQISRKQIIDAVNYRDTFGVQPQPILCCVIKKLTVSLGRNEEQRPILELTFSSKGDRFQWIVKVMSNLLVELGILAVSHLRGRTIPQWFHRVENLFFKIGGASGGEGWKLT